MGLDETLKLKISDGAVFQLLNDPFHKEFISWHVDHSHFLSLFHRMGGVRQKMFNPSLTWLPFFYISTLPLVYLFYLFPAFLNLIKILNIADEGKHLSGILSQIGFMKLFNQTAYLFFLKGSHFLFFWSDFPSEIRFCNAGPIYWVHTAISYNSYLNYIRYLQYLTYL